MIELSIFCSCLISTGTADDDDSERVLNWCFRRRIVTGRPFERSTRRLYTMSGGLVSTTLSRYAMLQRGIGIAFRHTLVLSQNQ